MSLLAILLFVGTMALSLWATIRVRPVYNRFSLLRASSGSTGADAAAAILRQEGISDVEIEFDASVRARLVLRQTGLIQTMVGDRANSSPEARSIIGNHDNIIKRF